jgi:hypothetical protein
MVKFMTENGQTASLKDTVLKLGLMAGDTKVSGSRESQSEKVLKLIRTALPREASGKAEFSPSSEK